MLQVAKPTHVTLKGANEVVPITTLAVPQQIAGRPPIKAILIGRSMMIKLVIRIRYITWTAPNCLTRLPGWPEGGKVYAKDTGHVAPDRATLLAPADPVPKWLVIV